MNLGEYMAVASLIGLGVEGSGPPPDNGNDGCGCGCSGIGCLVAFLIASAVISVWGIAKIISMCNF